MDTKKIRIGNDIRLAVDLRQVVRKESDPLYERCVYMPGKNGFIEIDDNEFVDKATEVYYPNGYHETTSPCESTNAGNPISIREIKAVLINTTRRKKFDEELEKKSRFINRFPIEPCDMYHDATEYNICNSGWYSYRAFPRRYYTIPYSGFGVYPLFSGLYKKLQESTDFEYIATVLSTEKQNIVEVCFPAEHQLYSGLYTLIIVAKVYAPGYNKNNLKTITVDIPNVFELVGTREDGIDTGINAIAYTIIDNLSNTNLNIVTEDSQLTNTDNNEDSSDSAD